MRLQFKKREREKGRAKNKVEIWYAMRHWIHASG